jgi:RNA polymerase sigma-70 factor, ECF subfamily
VRTETRLVPRVFSGAMNAVTDHSVVRDAIVENLEPYRRELTAHCRRMLRSSVEADDAVQETMLRAWRSADTFEGRASLRTWLYRIATNTCLDMLESGERRARPVDLRQSWTADTSLGARAAEHEWVRQGREYACAADSDPAELVAGEDTVRLAVFAAIQRLPKRQQMVFILRGLLRWRASEVAALLDTSVASVNSALQRARTTLSTVDLDSSRAPTPGSDDDALVARSVEAFERHDIDALVTLITLG